MVLQTKSFSFSSRQIVLLCVSRKLFPLNFVDFLGDSKGDVISFPVCPLSYVYQKCVVT